MVIFISPSISGDNKYFYLWAYNLPTIRFLKRYYHNEEILMQDFYI